MQSPPSLRVLVVEDDKIIGKMFLEILEMLGHKGFLARTGLEALGLLECEELDLILSDLSMPFMGGRELWQRLKSSHPRLAESMIFISAEHRDAANAEFLRTSGHTYLQKPFDLRSLMAVVQEAATLVAAAR